MTKRIAYTLLTAGAFGLLLSSFAFAQEREPTDAEVLAKEGLLKKDVHRFVPAGKPRTIWVLGGTHVDCTPWELADVQTTKAPEHGRVEIVRAEHPILYAKDAPQAKCNGKRIWGLNVNYKSSGDYKGPDEFDLFVMWPHGTASEMYFKMNVR